MAEVTRRGQRWADLPLRTKALILLSLPLGALLARVISGILLVGQINSQLATATQTSNAINDMNTKLQLLLDAETGVRGYAATHDPQFLAPTTRRWPPPPAHWPKECREPTGPVPEAERDPQGERR